MQSTVPGYNNVLCSRSSPMSLLATCLAYLSTLNMDRVCSSETSVNFYRTTQHYIPANNILNRHDCGNMICNNLLY
jgi:hypothetical protein